jgi:hypothetical protein
VGGHRSPYTGGEVLTATRPSTGQLPGYRVERQQPIAQGGILAMLGIQCSQAAPPAPFLSGAGWKKTGR